MVHALGVLCYGLILLFGVAVSVCFAGIKYSRKNLCLTGCFFLFSLLLQIVSWRLLGFDRTKELYPFIVHIPLTVFLTVGLNCSWMISLSSIFSTYLCCQIPRLIGAVGLRILQTQTSYYICYIVTLIVCYIGLKKYVAAPVNRLMKQSWTSCLLFSAVPFFYYLFDYITTVYTDLLYSGSKVAVQFIPSIVSLFYFVFVTGYYMVVQKQEAAQRERDMLAAQLEQAKTEFIALRQMQEQTRQYRHDMRHHFSLLQGLAAQREVDKIADYLQAAQSDLAAFTPMQYSKNETINLILSSFEARAKQEAVKLHTEAHIPDTLSISDTELCSLLSNSLENAINAAVHVPEAEDRVVSIQIKSYKGNLLLSVKNPYEGAVAFQDGLPKSDSSNHGLGTQNISAIAKLHGGQALFSAQEGMFCLKVMLPLELSS